MADLSPWWADPVVLPCAVVFEPAPRVTMALVVPFFPVLVEAGEAALLLGGSVAGVLLMGRREYFMMVLIFLCYSVVWSVKAVSFLKV